MNPVVDSAMAPAWPLTHGPQVAPRERNSFAGWVDLAECAGNAFAADESTDADGAHRIIGAGMAIALRGPLGGVRQEGGVVCAAVGRPRFASEEARRAAQRDGACAGWLALYREHGRKAFGETQGTWSVLIIDLPRRQLLAAVDRFAVYTLCYRARDGVIGFASRADEVPGREGAIDPQALFNYVYHHFIPAPRTVFRDVARLDSAHGLHATADGVRVERYWQPGFAPVAVPFADRKATFLAILDEAVKEQMAGESVGCYLSGGTDSSTVAGMAARIAGRSVKTFSIGFDATGYDEMHFARIAAKHFATEHHEYYVTPDDLVNHIPDVAASYDQPFGNSSALPAYFCAKMAHDAGVAKMLAGDGGDELFGGNSRYATERLFTAYERVPDFLKQSLIEPVTLGIPALRAVPLLRKAARYVEIARMPVPERLQLYNLLMRMGPANVLTPEFLARVDIGEPGRNELANFAGTPVAATLDRTLAHEWKYVLADNDIRKVTGTATLGGVEVGFPLLDDRLVDFSLTLAPDLKLRGSKLRYFFKEALRGFLPDEIITKQKHGFGLPFGPWLARTPKLREMAHDAVASLERRGVARAGFCAELFDRRIDEHAGYYGELVWILMMLEMWLRRHAPGFGL
jgi:asparagine synthase (glutamine-hydrolysing)